jgi:hypothetical protein
MKYIPICFALSIAILYIVMGVPPSALSKTAAVVLGIALLYFGARAKANVDRTSLWAESGRAAEVGLSTCTSLDDDLVARIVETLKKEPSEQLRELLAQPAGDKWSPEALQAARLVLDERSKQTTPEPVFRTVPRPRKDQLAREGEAAAPGISRHLLMLDVGHRVYCRWRAEPGTIIRWHDEEDRFYIRYDNGEGEWATLGMFD